MVHTYGFALPDALEHVATAIEESRELLTLESDWDEQGSPGYAEPVWRRAVEFLVRNVTRLWDEYGVRTEAARVLPGPHGSIDLDWRTPGHELLINIPANPVEPASFYGDDGACGHRVKGTLDTSASNRWLLMWLAE